AERLAFLLTDAAPPVLLTQTALADRLPGHAAAVLLLDDGWGADADGDADGGAPLDTGLAPGHLAYVLYTSGSTGQPKGAPNLHRGRANRVPGVHEASHLARAVTVLQKPPWGLDVPVGEFFGPLLAGARLVLAYPGGHRDPAYLADLIQCEGVTVCHFVPS